jgi:hypothetical protein
LAAHSEAVVAWRTRIDPMNLLRDSCSPGFDHVVEEFLNCLMRADYSSVAMAYCGIAIK